MNQEKIAVTDRKMTSIFERYLTVWIGLCIVGGILLGKVAPDLAKTLDGMSINVGGAPVVLNKICFWLFFIIFNKNFKKYF